MAKDHDPKHAPASDSEKNRKVQSRDELKERSVHGDRPGIGRRNGSTKLRKS